MGNHVGVVRKIQWKKLIIVIICCGMFPIPAELSGGSTKMQISELTNIQTGFHPTDTPYTGRRCAVTVGTLHYYLAKLDSAAEVNINYFNDDLSTTGSFTDSTYDLIETPRIAGYDDEYFVAQLVDDSGTTKLYIYDEDGAEELHAVTATHLVDFFFNADYFVGLLYNTGTTTHSFFRIKRSDSSTASVNIITSGYLIPGSLIYDGSAYHYASVRTANMYVDRYTLATGAIATGSTSYAAADRVIDINAWDGWVATSVYSSKYMFMWQTASTVWELRASYIYGDGSFSVTTKQIYDGYLSFPNFIDIHQEVLITDGTYTWTFRQGGLLLLKTYNIATTIAGGEFALDSDYDRYVPTLISENIEALFSQQIALTVPADFTYFEEQYLLLYDDYDNFMGYANVQEITIVQDGKIQLLCQDLIQSQLDVLYPAFNLGAVFSDISWDIITLYSYVMGLYNTDALPIYDYNAPGKTTLRTLFSELEAYGASYITVNPTGLVEVDKSSGIVINQIDIPNPKESKKLKQYGSIMLFGDGINSTKRIGANPIILRRIYPNITVQTDLDAIRDAIDETGSICSTVFQTKEQINASSSFIYEKLNSSIFTQDDDSFAYGIYDAEYNFENDTVGDAPSGWTTQYFLASGTGSHNIIAELDGHKNVVELDTITPAGNISLALSFSAQASGTIELWMGSADVTKSNVGVFITDNASTPIGYVAIGINSGKLSVSDLTLGGFGSAVNVCDVVSSTLYHVRIVFNCTAQSYTVYAGGSSQTTVLANTNSITKVVLWAYRPENGNIGYFDAIDFSWASGYYEGRNLTTIRTWHTLYSLGWTYNSNTQLYSMRAVDKYIVDKASESDEMYRTISDLLDRVTELE